jgi:hypothetical protein
MIHPPFVHNEINMRLREEETHIVANPYASRDFLKDILESDIAVKNQEDIKNELCSIVKELLALSAPGTDLHYEMLSLVTECLLNMAKYQPEVAKNELCTVINTMCIYAGKRNQSLLGQMNHLLKERSDRAQGIYATEHA